MKREFRYIRLKQGTKEWLDFRLLTGLGGSEVSAALASDSKELAALSYLTPIQLHLHKCFEPTTKFSGNCSSEEGKFQEKAIIERFKYYDLESPDQMGIYKNMTNKTVMNGVVRPNCIIQNPKYEWLFYSMDAMMTQAPKGKKPKCIIEVKNTTSMEVSRFVNQINPAHFLQVQTGLLITGFEIGYLCTLVDGRWFKCTVLLVMFL